VSLEVNISKANALIERYHRELGIPIADVIKTQMRLFLQAAMRITPPRTQKQGRDAVARDLKRAVQPISADDFQSEAIKRVIRKRDKEAFAALLPKIRPNWQEVDFDPALHTKARDRRNRVRKSQKLATLDARAWKDYLKVIQSRVGRMKAAWLPALRAVGGTAPAWIGKHENPSGHYENNTASPFNPSFTATNSARGIRNHKQILNAALRARVRAMTSDLKRRLREAGQRAGFKT
jgi:hypothetical protein